MLERADLALLPARRATSETVQVLDRLKELGFEHATLAGISIGMVDMIIPEEKDEIIDGAREQIAEVDAQYRKGVITDGERYNKIIDIWTHATEEISNAMFRAIEDNDGSATTSTPSS